MEDHDGVARRKLQFGDESVKPFKDKTFFVEVKASSMRQRVSLAITELGGTVETFLSKDIFVFITDSKISNLQRQIGPSGCNNNVNYNATDVKDAINTSSLNSGVSTPNLVTSFTGPKHASGFTTSFTNSSTSMSRGRALLLKARENQNCLNGKAKDSSFSTNNSFDSCLHMSALISIMDKAHQMGIRIEHVINFLKRCKGFGATLKPGKKSKHGVHGVVTCNKNYIKFEDVSLQYRPILKPIDNIPRLYSDNACGSPFDGPFFLFKNAEDGSVCKKGQKVGRFNNMKGGYCEMCEQYFTGMLKTHMKSSDHLKFVKNLENFDTLDTLVNILPNINQFLSKFVDSKHVDQITDVSQPVCSINTDDCSRVLADDNTIPKNSASNALSDYIDSKVKSAILADHGFETVESQVILKESNMFSDISEVSPSENFVNDLVINWPLGNASGVDEKPSTDFPNMHHDCDMDAINDNQTTTSLTPMLGLDFRESTVGDKTGQLKLKLVFGNEINVSNTSFHLKSYPPSVQVCYKKKKLKKKHSRKEKSIYCSQKTSDMKLKLYKMASPKQQLSTLTEFWRVKKTGDCKLVFSSRKRKNSRSDVESEFNRGQHTKRQRLVF